MRWFLFSTLPLSSYAVKNCYIPNYKLENSEKTGDANMAACQSSCASSVNKTCDAWTFQGSCFHKAGEFTLVYEKDAISYVGDCLCDTEKVPLFPGKTDAETNALFGQKFQPVGLQCWPDDIDQGKLSMKGEACGIKVLQTSEGGSNWKGNCKGLELVPDATDCEADCKGKPYCSTWQMVANDTTYQNGCWQGVGYDCEKGRKTDFPAPAGRIQHGEVNVIAEMTTHQLKGLRNVFDQDAYTSKDSAMQNCKEVCYSDLNCQYWQYFNHTGCWVENAPKNMLPFPLSLADTDRILPYQNSAGALLGGEFIQHYCSETTTTTTKDTYYYDWTKAQNQFDVGQKVWVPKDTQLCVLAEPVKESDSGAQVANDNVVYSVTRGYENRTLDCQMARRLALGKAQTEAGQYANVTTKMNDGLYKLKLDDGRTVVVKQEDLLVQKPTTPPPTTVAPTPAPHGWGASILTAVIGVCCVLGLVLCYMCTRGEEKKKKKKKDKKRGLEEEAPVEAPVVNSAPPPPAQTTSTVLTSATPTYAAAPVTIAAPSSVATYHAPVTYASAPVASSYVVAAPTAHTATYATSQVVHASPSVVQAAPTYVHATQPAYGMPTSTVVHPAQGSALVHAVPTEPLAGQ